MIVDVHAHFVPQAALETLGAGRRAFPSIAVTAEKGGLRLAFAGAPPTRPVSPRLSDLGQRKAWLEKQGIDRQLVGGWLDIFGYELPAEEGAEWCRFMNEAMLKGTGELRALAALATVPLQNGELAAHALEAALDAGFHGAMIGTQPKGTGGALDDPDLNPFWEAASAKKATIVVHAMFACGDDRLADYDLVNAVGRVTDTTTAMARLLFSGHLQRYPGVNLVICHAGAALPYVLGRLKRNHAIHPGQYADPADGFRRLYFDTVLFETAALHYLRDVAGAEKIMLGSDHPFPIGDDEPTKVVENASLTKAERRLILGGTAVRLFRLGVCGCGG